jgi:peptidylprolyl isomerase
MNARSLFAPLLAVLALAFAGCGSSDNENSSAPANTGTESSSQTTATTDETPPPPAGFKAPGPISKDTKHKPKVPKPKGSPPDELVVKDIVKGTGKTAGAGDSVSVQYVGVSFSDGKQFDASWDRGGQPFTFQLGAQQVIPGWDQGVAGMKAGGRRELVIPPALGYGEQGAPPAIAGNETLVFVVDLEKVGS